ncbi:MAG: DNA-methyltransferase [Candidatus Odinarchaeia archaeon]
MKVNQIITGDCIDVLSNMDNDFIDLTITSPPYDNLRYYSAKNEKELQDIWNFEKFKKLAKELYRVTKKGGVIVWVVTDATINGSETGTSFKQALFFKEIGFNLHDTMIWKKPNFSNPSKNRYHQTFEYMFILSKGFPRVFNPIMDRKNKYTQGSFGRHSIRLKDGTMKIVKKRANREYGMRHNVWGIKTAGQENVCSSLPHPAMFPEQLAHDHIISWSNEGDIVLDPMCGSGTTCKVAYQLKRKYIGIDISEEYCNIARRRVEMLF